MSVHTNQLVDNRGDGLVKLVHLVLDASTCRRVCTEHHTTTREEWFNSGCSRYSRSSTSVIDRSCSRLVDVRRPLRDEGLLILLLDQWRHLIDVLRLQDGVSIRSSSFVNPTTLSSELTKLRAGKEVSDVIVLRRIIH
ncbi:hypothetical protein D3C87_1398830 [compost metagenome]